MDKDKPNDNSSVYLYNKFLSILLALKESPHSSDHFGACPDIHWKLCSVLCGVKESLSNSENGICNNAVLQASLTILKMFLEICLLAPNNESVKSMWGNVIEKHPDFFSFCLSHVNQPITVRFLLTEVLAHFVFVSQKQDPEKSLFNHIIRGLDKDSINMMGLLCTIDHLCIISEDHECPCFDEFLSGKDGILRQPYFMKNLACSDLKVQIITFRIYSKTLSIINHGNSRKIIFENIDYFLVFIKKVHCDTVEILFWKFFYSLLPFPGEEVNEKSVISNAANEILNAFQARLGVVKPTKIEENNEYDVVFAMAVNTLLKSLLWGSKDFDKYSLHFESVGSIFPEICAAFRNPCPADAKSLIAIFMEEDEDLVDFLTLHLELYCFFMKESTLSCAGFLSISPWELFLELILSLLFDFSIFVDWLLSNETHFLRYLVRFLKLTRLYWSKFVEACTSNNSIPRFQTPLNSIPATELIEGCLYTFMKLRNSISKLHKSDLFPYSPEPLLKHLNAIEDLFESSDEMCGNIASDS